MCATPTSGFVPRPENRERQHEPHQRSQAASHQDQASFPAACAGNNLYAQVIDDERGVTIAAVSTLEKASAGDLSSTGGAQAGKRVGELIAERAKSQGVESVVFDRGGFQYHGVIRAIADGAREAGLKF